MVQNIMFLVAFYEDNKYDNIYLGYYYINGEKYIKFLKQLEAWQRNQEEDFNYLIEEEVKEEAISYNKNTDTYTFKEEEDKSYQNYYEDSFDLMRCNYIQNIRKRTGILSYIINQLDYIYLDVEELNNNLLNESLSISIYYGFKVILDEIEEKKKIIKNYFYNLDKNT